jgi:hypothetical protein
MLRTSGSEALVKYIVQSLFALFIGNNIFNVKMYYILTKSTIWSELAQQYYNYFKGNIFKVPSFICSRSYSIVL